MTVDEVKVRVEKIRKLANYHDAGAHAEADRLNIDVLKAIANLVTREPARLAAAALVVQEIEFQRHCE